MSFDARSLLESIMKGAGQPQQPQGGMGGGGLADILGQFLGGGAGGRGQPGAQGQGAGGLEDILRKMMPQGEPGGQMGGGRQISPGGHTGGNAMDQGGLGDILGKLGMGQGGQGGHGGGQVGHGGGQVGQGGGQPGGNLMDILGQILGQATDGVKDGAGRVNDATGATERMREALGRATGQSPDEIMGKLKDLVDKNQLGAGAALGGLGALVLGTKSGRSLAAGAAKLGALALIGGLAYKAYQNYSAGRPLISRGAFTPEKAPQGSGFDEHAVTQEAATTYIRAMISAAAADGRIDANEQSRIVGSLKSMGADAAAEEFIAREVANPASIDDLAASIRTPEEAVQVYTAARLAVEEQSEAERRFLSALAGKLGIDRDLAAHIDAAAQAA